MLIRQVTIDRFRGIKHLCFQPGRRTVILGPNNAGKSTVLSALDLLLNPGIGRPRPAPTEVDYFGRNFATGFSVEAVIGDLADGFRAGVRQQLEGWRSDEKIIVPETDGDGVEPVVRVRVRATADFDLLHEFAKPEADGARFGPNLRTQLGWIYDGRSREPLRELAFYQGGLLDRLFAGLDLDPAVTTLRQALDRGASSINSDTAVAAVLKELAADLRRMGLLHEAETPEFEAGAVSKRELLQSLRLALAMDDDVRVPLHRQGRGAQRLLLVAVLLRLARGTSATILGGFEEPEEALEPLRQGQIARMLIDISAGGGQIFVVTHSPDIARAFCLDDYLVLSERGRGEDARQLKDTASPVGRQAFERRVDGPIARALFCRVPVLVEGPSDRGVLEVFWNALSEQRGVPRQAEAGVDFVNCEGCSHFPAVTSLLAQAGKRVAVWAEQDNDKVIKEVARVEAEGKCSILVKASGKVGLLNLEGALTARSQLNALVSALSRIAEDRGYSWEDQRSDLVSRWTGAPATREVLKVATSLAAFMAAIPPTTARQLAAAALGANKPTPFEMKGARQGRLFAEALVANGGVPVNFEEVLLAVAARLSSTGPGSTILLSCDPADDGAAP